MTLYRRFDAAMGALTPETSTDTPLKKLGVAVSGGGDSMALMRLLARWAEANCVLVEVATVDHGLRAEAGEEAAVVAEAARALGLRHVVLRWQGWDGTGNLQARARAARYAMLAEWAARRGLEAVALGHTRDDVAETFVMRLARGSGVDGLAAMAAVSARDGATWLRPLLSITRADLRDFLDAEGAGWIEDPSNEDTRFDRVKVRQSWPALEALGLDRDRLADTAERLGVARDALTWAAVRLAGDAVAQEAGDLLFDLGMLAEAPDELRLRLVSAGLRFVSGAEYRPRLSQLTEALAATQEGAARQLQGCQMTREGATLRLSREVNAVRDAGCGLGGTWDGRWQVIGPDIEGANIAALGDDLRHCPDWRDTGLPRASLQASPAVRWGERLISAPLAGLEKGYVARLAPGRANFRQFLETH